MFKFILFFVVAFKFHWNRKFLQEVFLEKGIFLKRKQFFDVVI